MPLGHRAALPLVAAGEASGGEAAGAELTSSHGEFCLCSQERQRDTDNLWGWQRDIGKGTKKGLAGFALIREISRYCSAESLAGEKKGLPCKGTEAGGEIYLQFSLLSLFYPAERIGISSVSSVYCSSWHPNNTDFLRCWGTQLRQ